MLNSSSPKKAALCQLSTQEPKFRPTLLRTTHKHSPRALSVMTVFSTPKACKPSVLRSTRRSNSQELRRLHQRQLLSNRALTRQ